MIRQEELKSFPPGANPFHYDSTSAGIRLEKIGLSDVYLMNSGKLGNGFYIYNRVTGQRVRVRGITPE